MKTQLKDCPSCGLDLKVSRYYCSHCDTTIEGHFQNNTNVFDNLSPDQISFLLAFVKCEGKLNRLEDELHMSYPTLRNRLVDVIRTLGYEPGKEEQTIPISPETKNRIMDDLSDGKIDFEEAKRLLTGDSSKEVA